MKRLSNEIIVFVPEGEWNPELVTALKSGGTGQIVVDAVRDFRTPFGTHMIIAKLTVTRVNATTWDLREYVRRRLISAGLEVSTSDLHAPAKAQFFHVS